MLLTHGNRHSGAAELAKQLFDDCDVSVRYINVILILYIGYPRSLNPMNLIDEVAKNFKNA